MVYVTVYVQTFSCHITQGMLCPVLLMTHHRTHMFSSSHDMSQDMYVQPFL